MSSEEPRWPAELGTLDDVLDFLSKTGTPSLACSEFELDYYPPASSTFVEQSAYCDADGKPYRFFVFGCATSGVVYGDTGPHFHIQDGGAPNERSGHNFGAQLKALALPVRRDEDEDYDENKNKNMLVTPCTNSNPYDMNGGTWIDVRVGHRCVLWNEYSDSAALERTIPRAAADFPVSAGTWILGFGTLHKRESVHWETRRYELMVWDLRILKLDQGERDETVPVADPAEVNADVEGVLPPDSSSGEAVRKHLHPAAPADSHSGLVDGEEAKDGIDVPDLAATSDTTLSDVSASEALQEGGKRRPIGRGHPFKRAPHLCFGTLTPMFVVQTQQMVCPTARTVYIRLMDANRRSIMKIRSKGYWTALRCNPRADKYQSTVAHVRGMLFAVDSPSFAWIPVALTQDPAVASLGDVDCRTWISRHAIDFEKCTSRIDFLPGRTPIPLKHSFCLFFTT
ncbi:hypothetical protein C8R47DRAFT_1071402 [Mycena vitilis]|nr:hypothetical protein C8R47DRAFT_1071402 [Mycena vitilis]